MQTRARGGSMNLILQAFFVINLMFIATFVLGRCFVFKQKNNPNLTALFSIILGLLFVLYFISIISVVGIALFHHKYFAIFLLAFIPMPFIIGQKATYEKLRFYSNLQLAMFFASLLASYIIFKI